MAAALLKKYLGSRSDVKIYSAGLAAQEGMGASLEAIDLMEKEGIDLSNHTAQRLTCEMVDEATLVLTMTKFHRMEVMEQCPEANGKVYLLKEFDQRVEENFLDIPDPMGRPMEDYEICLEKMKPPLKYLAEKILKPKNNEK